MEAMKLWFELYMLQNQYISNLDNDWQLTSDEVNAYLRYRDADQLNAGPKDEGML